MNPLFTAIQNIRLAMRFMTRMQRVRIATTTPLTITLRDGSTVPGVAVLGLTYTAGAYGVALLAERGQPLVFPTA